MNQGKIEVPLENSSTETEQVTLQKNAPVNLIGTGLYSSKFRKEFIETKKQ